MLNFVLFCSGKGGDPNLYRPHRDDSQWWGRRDAQARCVAAALYGPPSRVVGIGIGGGSSGTEQQYDHGQGRHEQQQQEEEEEEERQVVFLYSEDLALLRMIQRRKRTSGGGNSVRSGDHAMSFFAKGQETCQNKCCCFLFPMPKIPTESNLVRVWKRAATNPAIDNKSHDHILTKCKWDDDKNEMMFGGERFYCYMELESWCAWNPPPPVAVPDISSTKVVTKYTRKEIQCMSKRTLLQVIQGLLNQWTSSTSNDEDKVILDFLRKWRLNSSQDVVLRKINQKTMQMAYWDLVTMFGGEQGEGTGTDREQEVVVEEEDTKSIIVPKAKRRKNGDGVTQDTGMDDVSKERLYKTLCHILTSHDVMSNNHHEEQNNLQSTTSDITSMESIDAIAIYLHETCHLELPVFGNDMWTYTKTRLVQQLVVGDHDTPRHIYVFLGAVRDITTEEYIVLQRACQTMNVPLVGCHLGPVAEFTSKIVTAVAFHSHVGVLNKAVKDLYHEAIEQKSLGIDQMLHGNCHGEHDGMSHILDKNTDAATTITTTCTATTIHTICMVPFAIQSLSCELQHRNQHMWNLVRVCVASLWRSKVASSSSSSSSSTYSMALKNKLSLCFQCGHLMHLDQNDLVMSLAERHQAAPTEHQILKALCEKIPTSFDNIDNDNNDNFSIQIDSHDVDKAIAMDFTTWNEYLEQQQQQDSAISSSGNRNKEALNFIAEIYQDPCHCNINKQKRDILCRDNNEIKYHYLFAIMNLPSQNKEQEMQHGKILNHLKQFGIPIIHHHGALGDEPFGKKSIDASVTITMLQHFAYHGRLFSVMDSLLAKQQKAWSKEGSTKNIVEISRKKNKKRKREERTTNEVKKKSHKQKMIIGGNNR